MDCFRRRSKKHLSWVTDTQCFTEYMKNASSLNNKIEFNFKLNENKKNVSVNVKAFIIIISGNVMPVLEINFHFNWFLLKSIFAVSNSHQMFIVLYYSIIASFNTCMDSHRVKQLTGTLHWQHQMTLRFDEPIPYNSWPIRQSNFENLKFSNGSDLRVPNKSKKKSSPSNQHHTYFENSRECLFIQLWIVHPRAHALTNVNFIRQQIYDAIWLCNFLCAQLPLKGWNYIRQCFFFSLLPSSVEWKCMS